MALNLLRPLFLLVCISVITLSLAQGQNSTEVTKQQSKRRRDNEGSLISMHQILRPQNPRGRDNSESRRGSFTREAMKERLDSILLVLSRISDRMVALETQQQQQNERIDNINYRITKLDLRVEETKTQFSDVWSTLRHRLETSDREMGRINEILDTIKTDVGEINTKSVQLNTKMESMRQREGHLQKEHQTPKLQSVLAAVFGVKGTLQEVQANINSMALNFTQLANSTRKFEGLKDYLVTKEDLHLGFAGMEEEMEDHSRTFISLSSPKKERNKKGESVDCWELLHKRGKSKSGVYRIHPSMVGRPFFVYCDMETDGGGWTVIQRREDGTEDFKRGWKDYKFGFGNLAGEFWMGNEKIFLMTNEYVNELRIELADFSQTVVSATYKAFAIGPESEGYALRLLSAYSGDGGDSLRYHIGQKWSTHDMDNDAWPDKSCAREHTGAWWYRSCDTSNLNGMYFHGPTAPGDEYKGIYWYDFHGPQYSLWRATMMIRRGGYTVRTNLTVPNNMKHSPYIPHPLEENPTRHLYPNENHMQVL